jgi:uncharacterized protein YdaU (DUF1376 family)
MSGKQTRDAVHFRFYPSDFLSSGTVQQMDLAEIGAYVKLLCLSWTEDGLPIEPERIRRILGAPEAFDSMWAILEPAFPIDEGEPPRRRNARQERERARLRAWKAERSEQAKRAAEARWKDRG